MLIRLITGDVNLDYLVKWYLSDFFQCKIANYSLSQLVIRHPGRPTLKPCTYPAPSPTPLPLVSVPMSRFFGNKLLLWCFPNGDFFCFSPFVFINQNYFYLIYSIFYLYQPVFIEILFYCLQSNTITIYFVAQIIPALALCPLDKLHHFLSTSLLSGISRYYRLILNFLSFNSWGQPFQQGALTPLIGEWQLESKNWVLVVFIATRMLFLLGPLST